MTDTLFADVSYFQPVVNDSYPHAVLSFRACDGTFRDDNFAENYQWAVNAVNSGKLEFFIVYAYWRSNWADTAQTMIDMVNAAGGPHPKMVAMIDVESGGNPGGDQSHGINSMYWKLADWLGNPKRVIGYANTPDFYSMWPTRPDGLRVVAAGYGSLPSLPGQIAHQYTDGQGYGGGLPEGAPPFGNCDMNSANGLSPQDFAAACGIGEYTPVPNAINDKEAVSGWLGKRLTADEQVCPDGVGRFVQYEAGYIYWHPETGAHPIPASLFARWAELGWEAGAVGYPTLDHVVVDGGECQAFQGGALYHKDGGPVVFVHGAIGDRWARDGFEKGPLGWPLSDEQPFDRGAVQRFDHGDLYWSPDSTVGILANP
ncbi:LGFP repeat-containing protein [Nocardia elegans]|uniref:LGFP repeat-containing protein n=1 Tax=Nocardia elegans TaxID=300029 RepID=A0ABW6TLK7_9NOCA